MDQMQPEKSVSGDTWYLARLVAGVAAMGVYTLLVLLPLLVVCLLILGTILWLLWSINAWFCVATILVVTLILAGISSEPRRRR